jgi:hypothetical protein
MLRKNLIAKLAFSILMITASGCSTAKGDESLPPAPTEMVTPATFTLTVVIPTASSTATASPTDTPVPEKVMLTFTKNAFCRKGPGVTYFDKGSFNQGDTAQAEGRNDSEPRWWYMLMENGDHCWVSDSTVEANPAAESLPIQLAEKSLPQTPPDVWADRVCKPGKGFAVTLNWTASSSADGYYVYVNGEQIQDITRATQTSYVIKLEMNTPVSYALEAYNSVGAGEQIIFEDPGCP